MNTFLQTELQFFTLCLTTLFTPINPISIALITIGLNYFSNSIFCMRASSPACR